MSISKTLKRIFDTSILKKIYGTWKSGAQLKWLTVNSYLQILKPLVIFEDFLDIYRLPSNEVKPDNFAFQTISTITNHSI